MRFGIMAMQVDFLIPPVTSEKETADWLTSLSRFEYADLALKLAQHGFNPIELGGDLAMLLPQTFYPSSVQKLAALKEEHGVSYTVHLPLWSVEPSTMLTHVRRGSVKALVENISATLPLEPEVFVLHATGELAAEFYLQMKLPPFAP